MGYYTEHNLEIKENRSTHTYEEVFNMTVDKLNELDVIGYALCSNLECVEPAKWYTHKEDMQELSKHVRDVVFVLSGQGEKNSDLWKEYWLNGRYHRCQAEIVYPEFDERKLIIL